MTVAGKKSFSKYDKDKVQTARSLLLEVLNYNYGDSVMTSKVKRLETIYP